MKTGLILGFFDGVHAGHKAVIESALNYAEKTVLITFKESPALYFGKKAEYIMTREDSINKLKQIGVNEVIELDFPKIASMTAQEYLEYLIKEYSPVSISTGFNHTFGLKKAGTPEFLEQNQGKYGYKYFCIPPVNQNGKVISSTEIRKMIAQGEINGAKELLGDNFFVKGKVIHGKHLGQTIGFPTANINYPEQIVKLPFGVYSSKVTLPDNRSYKAVTNWGIKPTVNNTEPVLETYLFDFNEDIYDKEIRIEFLKYVRKENKFRSVDELKIQIKKDIKACLE